MNPVNKYLLMKPSTRGIIEWFLLFFIGGCGYFFSTLILPLNLYFLTLGIVLLILGSIIHRLSHKEHKQAHSKAESIEKIVTTGIYSKYSKIRHPGYLGLILMYLGVAFLFHNILAIVGSIIFSFLQILTALAEEKYLIKKLREEYEEYMRRVSWRFIPKVF